MGKQTSQAKEVYYCSNAQLILIILKAFELMKFTELFNNVQITVKNHFSVVEKYKRRCMMLKTIACFFNALKQQTTTNKLY